MDMSNLPESIQIKWAIIFPLVISINALWYLSKLILKKNNFNISWFFNHFQDIPNMFKLAKISENPFFKIIYYLIPILILLGIPLMFIAVFWRINI